MERRRYLAIAAGLASLAGCADDGSSGFGQPGPSASETTAPGAAATTDPEVTVESAELITADSAVGEVPWAVVDVSNPTAVPHGYFELEFGFFDGGGALLNSFSVAAVDVLPADTTLRHYFRYGRADPAEVATVRVDVTNRWPRAVPTPPPGAAVVGSEITVARSGVVDFTATVETGNRVRTALTVYALLSDGRGRYRGTIKAVGGSVGGNTRIRLAAEALVRTPRGYLPVEDHETLLGGRR